MKRSALALSAMLMLNSMALPAFAAPEPTVTVMVYMCGSDLESNNGAATDDLYEMMDAGLESGGNVNVVILTGGCSEWKIDDISTDENELWMLNGDTLEYLGSMGQASMGEPDTLQAFIECGIENFPADRYGLVMWDHGGGASGGLCYDENYDDELMLDEFPAAILSAQQNSGSGAFDFVLFDACLMGSFEIAYNMQGAADYIFASEELISGCGTDYCEWMGALVKDPAIDTLELGKVVCDTYIDACLKNDPEDIVTLSVLDTSGLDAMAEAVESCGTALSDVISSGRLNYISRMRTGIRACGDSYDASSDMVDMQALADGMESMDADAAAALADSIDGVVRYTADTGNLEYACGISLLLPYDTVDYSDMYIDSYDAHELIPEYSNFVYSYISELSGGSYSFGDITPAQTYSTQSGISGDWSAHINAYDYSADDYGDGDYSCWSDADYADYFGDSDGCAYSIKLTGEQLDNLAFVEAALFMNASDEDGDVIIELGYVQDVDVNWDTGDVVGLFDGTWPTLEGQMVCMYDQSVTEAMTRSLINVTVNGEDTYLMVIFNDENPYGKVLGYTSGYDENGNPVRGYTKLESGDVIIPQYTAYYWDENDEQHEMYYEGDEIVYDGSELEFSYDYVYEDTTYLYGFCLNDIYGDYEITEYVEIEY